MHFRYIYKRITIMNSMIEIWMIDKIFLISSSWKKLEILLSLTSIRIWIRKTELYAHLRLVGKRLRKTESTITQSSWHGNFEWHWTVRKKYSTKPREAKIPKFKSSLTILFLKVIKTKEVFEATWMWFLKMKKKMW